MMAESLVIKKIRQSYPHLQIGLLTLKRSRELFKYNKDIDKLFVWHPLFFLLLCLRERLRRWDMLIDLNDDASKRSVLIVKLIKPKKSIGFHNKRSEKSFVYTIKTYSKYKSHVVKRISVMLKTFGIKVKEDELKPVVYLDERKFNEYKLCKQKYKKFLISINISSGHISRYWATEKWIMLIVEAFNKNNLHDFLSAIAISDLLISPDTSAIHAACAFNVPVIGLYSEPYWNFISFRPIGVKNIVIRAKYQGIDSIGFEEVKTKTIKLVKQLIYCKNK